MQYFLSFLLSFFSLFAIAQTTEAKLIDAVAKSDLAYLRKYVNASNVNTINSKQQSLLMMATYDNNFPVAEILVNKGADVNQQDTTLNSPFLYAAASGYTNLVKLYLENDAKFDVYNKYHGTALIPAAEKGHVEVVKLLVNTPNFPINHINKLGWTALLEAIILGDGSEKYVQVISLLLEAGADKNIVDEQGANAYQHAKILGFKEIMKLLE